MSDLSHLQSAFHDHLLDAPGDIGDAIRVGGRISTAQRLGIYHNAYRVRLVENLADTFEKTCAYIGEAHFDTSARAFLATHPPTARSLRDYGSEFSGFLAARYPGDPDIAELACMDWAMRQAFDSADATPLAADALASVPADAWETLGFELVPSVALLVIQHNTPAVWAALDHEIAPPAAARLPQPAHVLVWRRGWQPHFRTLDAAEARALVDIAAGESFSQICVAASGADAELRIAGYLRRWFEEELIAGLVARDRGEVQDNA